MNLETQAVEFLLRTRSNQLKGRTSGNHFKEANPDYKRCYFGFRFRGRVLCMWFVLFYEIMQVIFLSLWAIPNLQWSNADAWWIKLFGFMMFQSWRSPTVVYFLVVELLVGLVASAEINRNNFSLVASPFSCWGYLSSVIKHISL